MSLSKALLFPRLKVAPIVFRAIQTSSSLQSGHHIEYWWGHEKAGGREVVGHGVSGEPVYQDRLDYWYPAIRFRVDDETSKPLREKEKGDWKSLSADEKKLLYRYSYRQTLAEFEAPTGYWKLLLQLYSSLFHVQHSMLFSSIALFIHLFHQHLIMNTKKLLLNVNLFLKRVNSWVLLDITIMRIKNGNHKLIKLKFIFQLL